MARLKTSALCLRKMLPLSLECSVIVARSLDGQMVNFPVQRNLHREGILAVTEVYEGHLPQALQQQAVAAARSIAEGVNYVGVLCVEFLYFKTAAWWSMRWHRAPTTVGITRLTHATNRNSICKFGLWQVCL